MSSQNKAININTNKQLLEYDVTPKGVFIGSKEAWELFGKEGQQFLDRSLLSDDQFELLCGRLPVRSKVTLMDSKAIQKNPGIVVPKVRDSPKQDKAHVNNFIQVVNRGYKLKGGKNGKKGQVAGPTMNKEDPYEAANHLLKVNTDVSEQIGILNHRVAEFNPQVYIQDVPTQINLDQLALIAFKIVNSAYSRGILNTVIVNPSLPALPISAPYLCYLTICYDLYLAVINEISIFAEMPVWYWFLRNSITPREWKGKRNYFFDMSGQPSASTWVFSLNPYSTSINDNLTNAFGLAVPDGTEDPDGYAVLFSGSSTGWTLSDLASIGSPLVGRMVTSMVMNQSEVQLVGDSRQITPTVAAFSQCIGLGNTANSTTAVAISRDQVRGHHLWLSELQLVPLSSGIGIGNFFSRCHNGPVVFGYIIQYGIDPWQGVHFRIIPKQISISSILLSILEMFLQADMINGAVVPHGVVNQVPSSLILGMGAADFVQYVFSFLVKRYSQYNTVYQGTALYNPYSYLVGGSDQTYYPFDAFGMSIPNTIVESLARLDCFELPVSKKGNFVEVRLPVLCGFSGTLFNANSLDVIGASTSVATALNLLYPNVTFGTYVFGAAITSKYPFTADGTTYSKFIGSIPSQVRQSVSSVMSFASQNFTTSPALASAESITETEMYYTVICNPIVDTDFDNACTLTSHSITNKWAFDPNAVLSIVRILPIAIATRDELTDYTVISNETKSLDVHTTIGEMAMLSDAGVNNIYSGINSEQNVDNIARIEQHKGGGFGLMLGRLAGTVLPGVITAFSQAFGGQPGAEQKQQFMSRVADEMIKHSAQNVYNPLFRLVPRGGLSSGHRTGRSKL
jgi:hypothetical protein